MGGASSKVNAENIASQLISVISNSNSDALVSSNAVNSINLSGNCVFTGEIDQFINIKINSEIIQNIVNDTKTEQKLQSIVKQISEAEAPNLSLSSGVDSETFTKLINNLSTQISSSISTNCSNNNASLNNFNCQDYALFSGKAKQTILGEYFYKCTQDLKNVSNAKQELQAFIDQHSTAILKDVIVYVLICIAVILAIWFLGPSLGKLFSSSSKSNDNNNSSVNKEFSKKDSNIIIQINK